MFVLRLFEWPEILTDALEDELEHEERGGNGDEVHIEPSNFQLGIDLRRKASARS